MTIKKRIERLMKVHSLPEKAIFLLDSIGSQLQDASFVKDKELGYLWARESIRFAADIASRYEDKCDALRKIDNAIPRYLTLVEKFGPEIGSLLKLRYHLSRIEKPSLKALDDHIEEDLLGIGFQPGQTLIPEEAIKTGSLPSEGYSRRIHRYFSSDIRGRYDESGKLTKRFR